MNVTGPSAILERAHGSEIKTLVDKIEAFMNGWVPMSHDGGEAHVRFNLEEGEWYEDAVKSEITRLYEAAGWAHVSWRYLDRIEFYFGSTQQEASSNG